MMNKQERQNQIFAYIKSKNKATITDIEALLQSAVNRKTIQRDLAELIEKNLILQEGLARNTYYYISDLNKIFEDVDIDEYFKKDYEKREIKESFDFWIFEKLWADIFTTEETEELLLLQSTFLKNISSYDSQTLINKEYERIMIEFSWKSSAIEGNTYSLLNTEALIKENIPDTTKTQHETQMILNHKDAFNESIQNRQELKELKIQDIEYIHSVLIKRLDVAKNIRKHAVGITWTRYKPLDNDFQIKEALAECINLINRKESFFEKAFIALILLSYIQAFEDGNKRTARMFSNAILLAYNSIPLSYRVVDIVEYKKASILFYEIGNISYFKKIFMDQLRDAVDNYFQ